MNQFLYSITVANGLVQGLSFAPIAPADLPPSGVAPGTYMSANIQVDGFGRILNATNGGLTFDVAQNLFLGGGGASATRDVPHQLGCDNLAIGSSSISGGTGPALNAITTGTQNLALGNSALLSCTTGGSNVALGANEMLHLTTGARNTGVGTSALYNLTTGSDNCAIGNAALFALTTGNFTIAIGTSALQVLTSGSNNVGIGSAVMPVLTMGSDNVGIGASALNSLISSSQNVAIGTSALASCTGADNAAIGYQALVANTSGFQNTAFGSFAGVAVTTGFANTAIGTSAFPNLTTSAANTALGGSAGTGLVSGYFNTFLGTSTSTSDSTLTYGIAIGYSANVVNNNQCVIGGTGSAAVCLIWAGSTLPLDADLVASQGSLCWDFTPGSSSLLIKGKDSGGTVFSARLSTNKYLASDLTNSTSAFSNVTGFSFAIGASQVWSVEFSLCCTTQLGLVFQLTGPSFPTAVLIFTVGNTTSASVFSSDSQNAFSSQTQAYVQGTFNGTVIIRATIINGGIAGTVQLQMASFVNGQAATVKAGSFMRAIQMK